jgi:hypothetical protein
MALVLVEGEDELARLVGNATNNTSRASQGRSTGYWTIPIVIAAVFAVACL